MTVTSWEITFWIYLIIFSQFSPIGFLGFSNFTHHKLHFGLFPYFSSFYVQFSISICGFTLRTVFLLDIFLLFSQYKSNFILFFNN